MGFSPYLIWSHRNHFSSTMKKGGLVRDYQHFSTCEGEKGVGKNPFDIFCMFNAHLIFLVGGGVGQPSSH